METGIRPIRLDDGKEYYVLWCGNYQERCLRIAHKFADANWRRIKREFRKAWEAEQKVRRANG